MKILFVCTGNVARSPMAEAVFRELTGGEDGCEARSAGLGVQAVRRLTTRDLAWADVVAVMESVHLAEIRRYWPDQAPKVLVLGVPDDYDPGEPELQALLTTKVRALVDHLGLARPRTGSRGTGSAPFRPPG